MIVGAIGAGVGLEPAESVVRWSGKLPHIVFFPHFSHLRLGPISLERDKPAFNRKTPEKDLLEAIR